MALAVSFAVTFPGTDTSAADVISHNIYTAADLANIAADASGSYYLMNDLDLSEVGEWTPISEFSGVLDGQGYSITGVRERENYSAGLFRTVTGTIRNLHVDVDFYAYLYNASNPRAGGIATYLNGGTLENCCVTGGITFLSGDRVHAGSLAGECMNATIINCYSTAHLGANGSYYDRSDVCGIGYNESNSKFENCYFAGSWQSYGYSLFHGISSGGSETSCHYGTDFQMKLQSTYVGWDFEDVWTIDPDINDGYPYLRCEKNPNRTRFTITFHPNGGEVSPLTKTLTKDDTTYGELPTPTRDGYTFKGWYTATEYGTRIKDITKFEQKRNQTLYAVWSPTPTVEKYTVTFEANGGSVSPESITVEVGGVYGALPVPVRDGLVFLGWFTEPGGGTRITAETKVNLTANQTLYAHWAQEATVIHAVSRDGNTVTADIVCSDTGAAIFCGAYDNGGKMIAALSVPVTDETSYRFQLDGQQFDYVKVFIFDSAFRPLCDGKRS